MRKLGISIYPEKSEKKEMLEYIDKTSKLGFSRIFTCLLSVNKPKEEIMSEFKEINAFAKERGFEIILDVAPRVFSTLEISYSDLSFFKELFADGVRLDLGFTGSEEALMTFNPYDLKIELNMSNDTNYLDNIMDYKPNKYNLIGCHNFYPHRYCGLSLDYFNKCTKRFNDYGLETTAFITSQSKGSYGPWPTTDALPTLEMHRNLAAHVQLKHYVAMGTIDNFLVSNCYPTDEELGSLSKVNLSMLNLNISFADSVTDTERKIILNELHYNRGDISEYVVRSTQPRVKYRGTHFPVHNPQKIISKGDVVIESSEYGHYAGEVQVALKDMENSGRSNVVGRIAEDEIFLLDYIAPWQKFVFSE